MTDTGPGTPRPTSGRSERGRRHADLVAAGILLSRVAGLVREKLIAYFLGAGAGTEAFRAALRIPNLMQNLLGEGVLSASFIPVYGRLLAEDREEEAGRVAGAIAGLLIAVTGGLIAVGVLFADPVTSVIAGGFPAGSAKRELTVTLVRILTPGIGFLVLSAWCLGVLNSHRRFFLSYVAPVVWNAAMIAGLVTVALVADPVDVVGDLGSRERTLAIGLAWGTTAGGVLQFVVQLPTVLQVSRGLRLSLDTSRAGVRRVVRAFVPVVAGRGVVQLAAYLDVVLASFLATGALAALGFAQVLYLLPISLFGMSVAAAELPELSSLDRHDRVALQARLRDGLARVAFYVVPSVVVFVVLGDEVAALLFGGGEFGPGAARQVGLVLAAYSIGLLPTTASRLLQSALYGIGLPQYPARIAALRVAVAAGISVLLMFQLDQVVLRDAGIAVVGDLPRFSPVPVDLREAGTNVLRLGAVGLALGSAFGSWLEYHLLRRVVAVRIGPTAIGGGQLRRTMAAAGVPLAIGVVGSGAALGYVGDLGLVALAGLGHLAAGWVLGLGEPRDLGARIRRALPGGRGSDG